MSALRTRLVAALGRARRAQPLSRRRLLAVLALAVFCLSFLAATALDNDYVFVVGVVLGLAALAPVWARRPVYLLLAFLIYLPLEDALAQAFTRHVEVVRILPDALLFLAFAARAIHAARRRESLFRTPLDLPLAALFFVASVSMLANGISATQAAEGLYPLFRYAAVFYLAASTAFTEAEVRAGLRILVGLALIECVLALGEFALLTTRNFHLFDFKYVQGTLGYFNTLGVYLAISCVVALATYSVECSPRPRLVVGALLGLSTTAMLLALSRQSLLVLTIGWVVVAVVGRQRAPLARDWRVVGSGVAGCVLGLLLLAAQVRLVRHTVAWAPAGAPAAAPKAALLAGAGPGSLAGMVRFGLPRPIGTPGPGDFQRTLLGKANQLNGDFLTPNFYKNARMYEIVYGGRSILQESPWYGLGPGTFGAQPTYHDQAFYDRLHVGLLLSNPTHNYVADVEWMTILGQLGTLGVALWVLVILTVACVGRFAWRHASADLGRGVGLACIAVVPMFVIAGFTGPNFEVRAVSVWLWLLPGLAFSLAATHFGPPATTFPSRGLSLSRAPASRALDPVPPALGPRGGKLEEDGSGTTADVPAT